jgi:hypothetical protein
VRRLRLAREPETFSGEVRFDRARVFGARFAPDETARFEQVCDP